MLEPRSSPALDSMGRNECRPWLFPGRTRPPQSDPRKFQSALLATLCGDCEWLGLASTEALHSAIIAAISSVGDELAMELICEIRAMDRDKHDFVLLAK